jgi:type I restriction enzyme M protein
MSDDNIKNIVDAYRDDKHQDGFARTVELSEIRDNDFNLNVSLYVFPDEETESIDIRKEWKELSELEKDLKSINTKIESFLNELNY